MSDMTLVANEVKAYIKRFCYLDSETKYDTAVLWVFHTHVRNSNDKLAFAETPRLAILSDMPASGKTRLLELIESLSFNGQRVLDPSPAGMFCALEEDNATIGLDEIDLFFGRNGKQSVRTIINAGYRVGSFVRHANAKHDTFGPMVMAGMGQNFSTNQNLAATKSRSIIIRMDRRPDNVTIEPYRALQHRPYAHQLRDVLSDWGTKYANELAMSWPDMPEGVNDRDADIWTPLLACAEYIGDEWIKKANIACRSSVLSENVSDIKRLSPTQQLMEDMSNLFYKGEDKISTMELLERLKTKNDSWAKHSSIRAAAMELSNLLAPIELKPKKVRIGDRPVQGFVISDIAMALPDFKVMELPDDDDDVSDLPLG